MVPRNTAETLINKALAGQTLDQKEIVTLLMINEPETLEMLFKAAREVRSRVFANRIFLYGFVYFSTWCRNDCTFCYYRRSNDIERYRKGMSEVLDIAESLASSGVHLVDLTMGEDELYRGDQYGRLLDIIKQIKIKTGLPVMISPGVIEPEKIDLLAAAGVEWYALYQETHNRELFRKLRVHQDYDRRMNAKLYALSRGMLIEEGILVGVGDNLEDIAHSLAEMGRIKASQVRVMSFVPQTGTPLEKTPPPPRQLEMKTIAVMRLLYPYTLIPASLDIEGLSGLKMRLDAGANVVTSIIPPREGLMGVAQYKKDIDEGCRSADEVRAVLAELGLDVASVDAYKDYLNKLRSKCHD